MARSNCLKVVRCVSEHCAISLQLGQRVLRYEYIHSPHIPTPCEMSGADQTDTPPLYPSLNFSPMHPA